MKIFYLLFLLETGAYPLLALNSRINSVQESEWSHFELSSSEYFHKAGSLRFTLSTEETSDVQLVLALSAGAPALFNVKRTHVLANHVDYNGWLSENKKHFIVIRADTYNSTTPLYISVGRPAAHSEPTSFSLSSEYSERPLCANDCSGNGSCFEGRCICKSHFIGYDCKTPATLIIDEKWKEFSVPINSTSYGYFYLEGRDFFQLSFEWEGPVSLISLNWRGYTDSELPSETCYYSRTLLVSSDNTKDMIYTTDSINSEIVYIAVMNVYHPTENVQLKLKLTYDYAIEYNVPILHVLIGTFSGIFIVFLVAITVKCKYDEPDELSARDPPPAGVPDDVINKTCPRIMYQDLERDIESNCAICLEQFKPCNDVRKLRCNHIFHAKCIDEWFKCNVSCCLCKRDCSVIVDFSVTGEHLVSSVL